MAQHALSDPALTVALALLAGMVCQALAWHLGLPGIVLLLGAGVLLGPDVLGIVRPESLGGALQTLVGFAVAVILFEGGMNLNLRRLRQEAASIRRLVTLGALVTALGGTLSAKLLLGWGWRVSALFGTIMIVTGPTVITPLLRRIRVQRNVATVLEAEGVLGDAVGAVAAVVALEVVLSPSGESVALGAWGLLTRLGFGALAGLLGGLALAGLLRFEPAIPEGLENVFTLSLVVALFQASNAAMAESGIMTVIAAGLVVGNMRTRASADLREFKEQLTVMLIGMLFVLLAADVRLGEVLALGRAGLVEVLVLALVVRPLDVLIATRGTGLAPKEKVFLSWLAPRGIVAAAVSSLFAEVLHAAGIPGGQELRAEVFLVIAATVLVQGSTGGLVAHLLGLRRPSRSGWAILGANALGREVGRVLRDGGQEVVFIDANPDFCRTAQGEGYRVLHGSALEDGLLRRADVEGRAGCLALSPNEEVNFLFGRKVRRDIKQPRVWVALRRGHVSVTDAMVRHAGARVFAGEPRSLDAWIQRLERRTAARETWRWSSPRGRAHASPEDPEPDLESVILPLVVRRGRNLLLFDEDVAFRRRDVLHVLVNEDRRAQAEAWFAANGWEHFEEDGTTGSH